MYFVKCWKTTNLLAGNLVKVEKTAHLSQSGQPVVCIRQINNDLIAHEELIDLPLLSGIYVHIITIFMQDILLRMSLPAEDISRQCNGRAVSIVIAKKTSPHILNC